MNHFYQPKFLTLFSISANFQLLVLEKGLLSSIVTISPSEHSLPSS